MTDFIDALEAQLVTAHRDRRRRRFAVPWRGGAVLVAATVVAAAVVALVLVLASPDAHRAATKPPAHDVVVPAARHDVTVAVLNGTMATGIARKAADTLTRNGFREGIVTNDQTNQQRRRSTVYYAPGHKEDAVSVMGYLHLGLDQVRPMDTIARALGDRAPIVVFLGADAAR
jgi:hypothetical protein